MVPCMAIHVGIASLNNIEDSTTVKIAKFISCTKLGYARACKISHYMKIHDDQNGTKNHNNSSHT